MKQGFSGLLILTVGCGFLMISGCENETQNKAAWGAAIGAGVGQLVGGDTKGTLIGAGIGAGVGAAVGHSEDQKAKQQQYSQPGTQSSYQPADANVVTVWVTNSNGSKTPVKLTRRADGGYTGPKGEVYDLLPTVEQLKAAYGF